MNEKTIYVYENWSGAEPVLLGKMYVSYIRGKDQLAFEYDTSWLVTESANYFLDPDLMLYNGRQYAPMDKTLFGVFADSCPDRWGRLLMQRREAVQARKEDRKPRALGESDFLLGVYDKARMGALRFKTDGNDEFLSSEKDLATPPWTTLRALEAASIGFEQDESGLEEKWLKQLIAPGSSLGGARPKATVQDEKGNLWIAKFPSKHDEVNSGAEPEKDLKELWKRIVFNMAVSNTDDHLRNHGFILSKKGWRLSPLYDVNPVP